MLSVYADKHGRLLIVSKSGLKSAVISDIGMDGNQHIDHILGRRWGSEKVLDLDSILKKQKNAVWLFAVYTTHFKSPNKQ